MLNKVLLATPKEFKISVGTQTHCSVQLSNTSAMPGEKVTFTVTPAAGYGNVTAGISTNGSVAKENATTFSFVMPYMDVVVSASASVLAFKINVNKQGNGTVNVKSIANYGEVVTVSFSPGEDYKFGSIAISGVALSGSGNSRTFTMPAHDITINVVFSELYPGFTPCVIKIGYRNRFSSGVWAGYSSQNSLESISSLSPQIVNNLCVGRPHGSTGAYTNVFDSPVYINGVLYDNSKSSAIQMDALTNLNGQTLKCYVKRQ